MNVLVTFADGGQKTVSDDPRLHGMGFYGHVRLWLADFSIPDGTCFAWAGSFVLVGGREHTKAEGIAWRISGELDAGFFGWWEKLRTTGVWPNSMRVRVD